MIVTESGQAIRAVVIGRNRFLALEMLQGLIILIGLVMGGGLPGLIVKYLRGGFGVTLLQLALTQLIFIVPESIPPADFIGQTGLRGRQHQGHQDHGQDESASKCQRGQWRNQQQ